MLARVPTLRGALVSALRSSAPRRTLAEAAAVDETKLKFNFFLPHQTLKHNAHVVSRLPLSVWKLFEFFIISEFIAWYHQFST